MKTQTKFFTAAAATAIAGLVSAAPAQAITFGSGLIQGDGSNVHFTFLESQGYFQSEWGVYNKTTGQEQVLFGEIDRSDKEIVGSADAPSMGTCGITVLDCTASFTFESGNEYSFFLRNINDSGHKYTMFSANELNPDVSWMKFENQTKFFSDLTVLDDETYKSPYSEYEKQLTSDLATLAGESVTLKGGVDSLIAFEDLGRERIGYDESGNPIYSEEYVHGDWNDFLVTATVPEPATLLGLGVVAGAMTLSRRRKKV